jgi:site-specific recombinase XerC
MQNLKRLSFEKSHQPMDLLNPDYYLFEGQSGGTYNDRSVQNIMEDAVLKSREDENAKVHILKHSFATHMLLG